jgi:GT2 family glycosyltransferase
MVSVVVVAWRNAERLETCLAALAAQGAPPSSKAASSEAASSEAVPFETLVVLNGASDEVVAVVRERIAGARVVQSRVNRGFGGGANLAAAEARGQFLVFLNDDTEVQPGWLANLVDTARAHPEAGALGSRTITEAGYLLEAGSVLWRNGSVWHVGRGLPATTTRYRYLRRVDYCSGSSLLLRRDAWDAAGGFDEGYFPGYYEDVDLCLQLRRLGFHILYEPRSVVSHHESSSLDHRYKLFVSGRSRARFLDKWRDRLPGFLPEPETLAAVAPQAEVVDALPGVQAGILASRRLRRRVLVADGDHSGPALAALVDAGWAVTTLTGDQDELGRLGVEVAQDGLAAHLATSSVLYDAVVGRHPVSRRLASLMAVRQSTALVAAVGAGRPPEGRGSEGAAVDVALATERPDTWPAALDEAVRRRVDEARKPGAGTVHYARPSRG